MPKEFEEEVDLIFRGSERLELVTIERPETYGWLRRPEFDRRRGVAVWEKPDGMCVGVRSDAASSVEKPDRV